jgi:general secretion pathway protein I
MKTRTFPRRQRGFSLVELVAAFVVFALSFGVLMGILSASIRNTRLAAEYTQAALWAQSRLDVAGIGEKLEAGHESGKFDDEFRWELDISKYEPPPYTSPTGQQAMQPSNIESFQSIELYRIDLEVLWGGRRNPKSAHFVSLRSANADVSNMSGDGSGGGIGQQNGGNQNSGNQNSGNQSGGNREVKR